MERGSDEEIERELERWTLHSLVHSLTAITRSSLYQSQEQETGLGEEHIFRATGN